MELRKVPRHKVDKNIQIEVNWQHTQEVTPAMRLLLMLLLRPRGKNEVKLGGSR